MASSTASPPRMPVSQSWTTATRGKGEANGAVSPGGVLSSTIAARSGIGRRFQRIVGFRRALVTNVIVAEILLSRHFDQTLHADMTTGPLRKITRRHLVVHE